MSGNTIINLYHNTFIDKLDQIECVAEKILLLVLCNRCHLYPTIIKSTLAR